MKKKELEVALCLADVRGDTWKMVAEAKQEKINSFTLELEALKIMLEDKSIPGRLRRLKAFILGWY